MYHQFKELADVDITREPMEVGPTCHYIMGGVRVEADTAAATVPGLFAAGEAAGGMHGSNRLGGNSLSDLLVFGRRAGLAAAEYALGLTRPPAIDPGQVDALARELLAPFERPGGENPYAIQHELQAMMQDLVGIVRVESEMRDALERLASLRARADRAGVGGHREYNSGWHTALDLPNLLLISEAITRAGLEREESRGAHFREDHPAKSEEYARFNIVIQKGADGQIALRRQPLTPLPSELARIIKENE
jgi:succinate dehydrogenase / fumarate reductase flavoprotein subunit